MELLYVYIKEYECFKNVDFHFSIKYKFEFKSGKLKCFEKEQSNITGFWGKGITNLNVIVGDNGAGKTTLLKCIMECITYEGAFANASCFFVFFDKVSSNIKIYTCGMAINRENIENNIEGLDKLEVFNNSERNGYLMPQLKKNKLIFLNNMLGHSDYLYEKDGQVLDFSVGSLIRQDFKKKFENRHIDSKENILVNFFNNEIYRQLEFVYNYKFNDFENTIPFELPNKLDASFVNNINNLKNIYNELKKYGDGFSENLTPEKQEFHKKIENMVYLIHNIRERSLYEDDKEKWCALMAENIVSNSIKEITVSPIVPSDREKELDSFLDAYESLDKNQNILFLCNNFLDNVAKNLNKRNSFYKELLKPYIDFIKWIIQNYKKINFDFSKIGLELLHSPLFSIRMSENDKKIFEEFFKHYQRSCIPFYYLNFKWGLSTGENNFLSTYSRLYSTLKNELDGEIGEKVINNFEDGEVECTNILLLIDEADLSYHPEWQSAFIDSMLRFLPSIFRDCDIQIILTTHSPIMLSDVPKSNVIYLKKGRNDSNNIHKETFGQNIYTLFNDAFYFGNSKVGNFEERYIIGKFAKNKIEKVTNTLKDILNHQGREESNLKIEEVKEIIRLIGEPVIKFALNEKLKGVLEKLEEHKSNELQVLMKSYDKLSSNEKKELIEYIIGKEV
ncbi:AAA family ATPase [Clostridium thailandense]|nr:AAA family ATPase [Clostridium thailandense]